ncbi:hypothetical protein N7476_005006 [Penicillium atrosanguineum]|uniref:Uncharacterized protein n=1 Tax=Penicillium atrosanguineum TaxID=1132637 RepID=A0A9W9Q0Q5_9EURO|nr:hypothetical protein N7476_005006 [Penicillium atrosanguineum]
MTRKLFTEEEVRLATERRLKYIGAAKVSISQIQFDPPLPRDLDTKNVARLRSVFRKNRCRRLDVDNHIPAILSRLDLANALRKANIPQQSLLTNDAHQLPRLGFMAGQLQGLHGRHRVRAGSEILSPADRWWTVDLYLDDIGEELRTFLVEEYANQKKPTDGDIYRKIRQYEGEYDEAFRERWFVRLSQSNQERLDQLDNKRNRRLRRAFDRLLAIPGLWPGMRISVLHRLIASGCVEEIITYLDHIWEFWSSLVASDSAAMKKINQDTVESLQLLAPGKCRKDAKTACGLVLSGQAFARFSDEERKIIWDQMQDFDSLIPSLYTFFEDFKYLESCAHCVKRLYGPSTGSVWETMSSMFAASSEEEEEVLRTAECMIQTSESTFRRQPATDMGRLETAYLQVWLYSMRHYPLMPPDPKNDDELLAKPARAKPDERTIFEMAELARQLGFASPEISALIDSSPDHQIARSALLKARKPGRYRYDRQQFDILVNQIVNLFAEAVPDQPDLSPDLLADSAVKLQVRSGVPQTRTHNQDSPLLFLDRLYADIPVADTITSFFVRRCVYFAFFGKSAKYGPSHISDRQNADADQGMADVPRSPLFVGEESPSGIDASAVHTNSTSEPSRREQESQAQRVERDKARPSMRHQQVLRAERERDVLRRRRRRKGQIRKLASDPGNTRDQEPMEPEVLNTEMRDQEMSDQTGPSNEDHAPGEMQSTSAPVDAASVSMYSSHGSSAPEVEDAMSDCTRVSIEAIQLEQEMDERAMIEGQDRDEALEDQNQTDHAALRVSSRSEVGNLSNISGLHRQQELDDFLAGLTKAQEEQERVEEEMERERLHEELGLSQQARTREEESQPEDRQIPPPLGSNDQQTESASQNATLIQQDIVTTSPSETSSAGEHASPVTTKGPPRPQDPVEIQFWVLEREQWKKSDHLFVDRSDPSPVERVAQKYTWKDYSHYDLNLHSLSPANCYRAAIADGNNAIFLISEEEEKRLAAEGRLVKDKQLLSMASRVLDRAEEDQNARPGSMRRL